MTILYQTYAYFARWAIFVGTLLGALVFSFWLIFSGTSQLSSGDAFDSICPKGWGIARYGISLDGGYYDLFVNNYGIKKRSDLSVSYQEHKNSIRPDESMTQTILSFNRQGRYLHEDGTRLRRNTYAYYWYSNVYASNVAYMFSASAITVNPTNNYYKGSGLSVRCVAIAYPT